MEYSKLDELIRIPKKGEASQANKKLYVEEMLRMLKEEGLSDTAVNYLRSGFGFSAAKPLAMYILQTPAEDRGSIIDSVTSGDLLKKGDKVAAFKMAVSLSAYSILWLGEDTRLLSEMIKVLPGLSKNKEKQMLKDAAKIYEKYFLSLIKIDTKFPPLCLEEFGPNGYSLCAYRNMLETIMGNVSDEYRAQVETVRGWIGTQKTSEEVGLDAPTNPEAVQLLDKNVAIKEEGIIPSEPYSARELELLLSNITDFTERMRLTVDFWNTIERSNTKNLGRVSDLERIIKDLQDRIDLLEKKNVGLAEESAQGKAYILELRGQNKRLEEVVTERDGKIFEQQEEIARLNAIISVYSADKQNSQSEQLNAIASKLKSEYRDFQDAAEEEMSIDLGENFRFQLQSIFRILIKSGIDVERR